MRDLTSLDVLDVDLTGGKKIDAGDGSVTDGNETLRGGNVHAGKVVEVLEEGTVWGSHCELNLGKLGQHTEESHLSLSHGHLSHDSLGALGSEHH